MADNWTARWSRYSLADALMAMRESALDADHHVDAGVLLDAADALNDAGDQLDANGGPCPLTAGCALPEGHHSPCDVVVE